ncbi:MAG: cold shock domain-containing protein [Bacilli bacterium]|nr:cold shock domain-containing protein [Mollicutes bacterium]MDY6071885.1 cold shock domain-containing protein [Bacilli bacterium]
MSRGRVKWFNNDKGYGFIEYEGLVNEDIFVHYSAIEQEGYKTLKEGEIVEFTLIETAKGSQAINVREVKLSSVV